MDGVVWRLRYKAVWVSGACIENRQMQIHRNKNTFDTLSKIYSMHANAPPQPRHIICSTFSTSVVLSDCNLGDIGTKPLNVAPVDPL